MYPTKSQEDFEKNTHFCLKCGSNSGNAGQGGPGGAMAILALKRDSHNREMPHS